MTRTISTNGAPVLTLWAAVVGGAAGLNVELISGKSELV